MNFYEPNFLYDSQQIPSSIFHIIKFKKILLWKVFRVIPYPIDIPPADDNDNIQLLTPLRNTL